MRNQTIAILLLSAALVGGCESEATDSTESSSSVERLQGSEYFHFTALEEMAATSRLILVGRVAEVNRVPVSRKSDGTWPAQPAEVVLNVERQLGGYETIADSRFTYQDYGWSSPDSDTRQSMEGSPVIEAGNRVLVFLRKLSDEDAYRPVSSQGTFVVTAEGSFEPSLRECQLTTEIEGLLLPRVTSELLRVQPLIAAGSIRRGLTLGERYRIGIGYNTHAVSPERYQNIRTLVDIRDL